MTLIFQDLFTEATTDTNLDAHTPDLGTGWTETVSAAGFILQASFLNDVAKMSGTKGNRGIINSADATYSGNEYDIEVVMAKVRTSGTDDPMILHGRMTATDSHYGLSVRRSAVNIATFDIFKDDAGIITSLASATTAHADGDEVKFEVRDVGKKGFKNGLEIVSNPDNVLTTGKGGLGMGNIYVGGSDVHLGWELDNFRITEVGGAPPAGYPAAYYDNHRLSSNMRVF